MHGGPPDRWLMCTPDLPFLIHAQFRAQARHTPDAVALIDGERAISYAELGRLVERVAGALQSRGIGEGAIVGLHVERSIEWVAAMLGILAADAAALPLPPSYPAARIREILAFASPDAVVVGESTPLAGSWSGEQLQVSVLCSEQPGIPGPAPTSRPDQPALVLASSGSTGTPKLIVRSHRSFFHRLRWTWRQHPFRPGEVGCQKAHMTTTHAVYELLEPLLRGVPVVIVPDADVRNLERFWEVVRARSVSRLLIVPSALRASLDMPGFTAPPLEVVVLMGEYVPPSLAERALAAFPATTHLYSIYGSTEASSTLICNLREAWSPGREMPLGTPISPEVVTRVLNERLEAVPPGEVGRLYLAGPALFTGYFRDPALTASVLVREAGRAEPWYDTRDQVRLLVGGELEFVGRVDHTVKIRGFRVDLPEVERALLAHPGVSQAAVAVRTNPGGETSLLGFVTPETVDRAALYATVRDRLPAYMVPSSLAALATLPLTPSGKVDRRRLLEEHGRHEPAPHDTGRLTETERRVRETWERTLEHAAFDTDSSFFEVGGTSLTVFVLVHRLREQFGLSRSQLDEQSVYCHASIRGLAACIDGIREGRDQPAGRAAPILVTLRRASLGSTQPPLFLVASAGGTLGAYEKLVRSLRTSREVVGVRDPFLWGDRDPTLGFARWVERYLEAIRERQPTGPYHIVAYSSAGAFGYELACRLRAAGEEVGLLALVDPLALDRSHRRRFGWWALRATWSRPAVRAVVRLVGWLRAPWVRLRARSGAQLEAEDPPLSAADFEAAAAGARRAKGHLLALSALLELNSGQPFALAEADFDGVPEEQYLSVLQSRIRALSPEVDEATIERIVIQYGLQVRAQHAYRLRPYDGLVLLVEPATRYAGMLAVLLRPHVRRLEARIVSLGPPSGRTRQLVGRFGALEGHYRSMRDDTFVEGLAREIETRLG